MISILGFCRGMMEAEEYRSRDGAHNRLERAFAPVYDQNSSRQGKLREDACLTATNTREYTLSR